ncbi:DUF6624 domain-containing protein [Flavobacterium wongokense]|uniref:DUF6624 domain-containing protein n=1 Tax=Flavobacterium wongokense TaxID=2910674 RepID=UPI001F19EC2C|nr:DUF6624 domain-containing protein [Flavobacterium sp. WG47]MCF6132415.1 hypothetical protein [Flavobacterium sp. WG47]
MKQLSALLLFCLILTSCQKNTPYSEAMKADLQAMYDKDQKAQEYDMAKVQRKSYGDSMEVEFNKLCVKNTIILKKYFAENGYPGIKENGEKASLNFWLLAQHSDHDVAFQEEVLKAMEKELKNKNANPSNYAYLYDRVQKNQNKPQRYGTQMVWDSHGVHSPYNLESPKKVDERRASMGLGTLAEYLKEFEN